MTKELAKNLTTALVQWIERERPEGTVCCSSYECEKLEKAFEGGCYDVVESLIKRKLSGLTEFEKCMLDFAKARDEYEFDSTKVVELNNKVIELTKSYSKKLLALAKEQLLSYADESNPKIEAMADLERTFECNPEKLPQWLKDKLAKKHLEGYIKGQEDAEKRYNESVAYHLPIMPTPPSGWGCDGTHCTNPHMDCINCPRKTTGGMSSTSTSSGTSTLKAEGNTSITDGKAHNPSFTD